MKSRVKLLFFTVTIMTFALNSSTLAAPKVGEPTPALIGPTFLGSEFDLSHHKGKAIVIHFMATWCSACVKEMPLLNHFYQGHKQDLDMIGLSVDRTRDRKKVLDLTRKFDFPVIMLNETKKNDFGLPESMPITYFIDQKGIVRKIFEPQSEELTDKSLSDALATILAH